MSEKRKNLRNTARSYLGVIDQKTGLSVGCLVDLNTDGMRVMGETSFDPKYSYKLQIELSREIMGSRKIELEVTCIWRTENTETGLFNAGFSLNNVSHDNIEIIKKLTETSLFANNSLMRPEIINLSE